jgi:hypothetical protein
MTDYVFKVDDEVWFDSGGVELYGYIQKLINTEWAEVYVPAFGIYKVKLDYLHIV